MNRHLKCSDCDVPRWVNQKSWRKLREQFGSTFKIRRANQCRECQKLKKTDPFEYQIKFGKPIKELRKRLKKFYLAYRKDHKDTSRLQTDFKTELTEFGITDEHKTIYQIDRDNNHLNGVLIEGYKIMGQTYELRIPLFTAKEFNKKWELNKK